MAGRDGCASFAATAKGIDAPIGPSGTVYDSARRTKQRLGPLSELSTVADKRCVVEPRLDRIAHIGGVQLLSSAGRSGNA